MPPRGNRIATPDLPPPAPAGTIVEPGAAAPTGLWDDGPLPNNAEFHHEGLDLFHDTGDMAALQDDHFRDWSWTVYRMLSPSEMMQAGRRDPRVFVTKSVGPFDVLRLQQAFGGGTFEIRGVFDRRLRIREVLTIEGPRIDYEGPKPHAPFLGSARPVASATVTATVDPVAQVLEAQGKLLEKIAERLSAPAAAPAAAPTANGMTIGDVIALADRMNRREVPTASGDTIKELIGVLRMGMDLKAEVGAAPESLTDKLIDKGLPMLERIALGMFTARNGGVRRAGPGPASAPRVAAPGGGLPEPPPVVHRDGPSSAAVVENPEPAAPADVEGGHRWPAAVEALAHSIERQDDPRDFPATLELLLPPEDISVLVNSPDDGVIAQLRVMAGGGFPVLDGEPAAAWIRVALAELRTPTEAGED